MAGLVEKFGGAKQFYPTPKELAQRMCDLIDWENVTSVLEPSAGKGNLCYEIKRYIEERAITAVELDKDLCAVLRDDFRVDVIQQDFLTFKTFTPFDCVVMNPPFADGAKHMMHALRFLDNGGQLVGLLNAQTLRNPSTYDAQSLVRLLKVYNAKVTYLQQAFVVAERKTTVEVALAYVNIPKKPLYSNIFNKMQEKVIAEEQQAQAMSKNWVDVPDTIKAMIRQYNAEVRSGLQLIKECKAMEQFIPTNFGDESYQKAPIMELKVGSYTATPRRFLSCVRAKYWKALLIRPEFTARLTQGLLKELRSQIDEIVKYEFTYENIYQLRNNMLGHLVQALDDTILEMFEKLTYEHSMECANNVHYYNGWRSNSAYKINKKIIIPWMDCWDDTFKQYKFSCELGALLEDIENIFGYLGGELPKHLSVSQFTWNRYNEFKQVHTGYFIITLYKKGTAHVEFKDETLLKRFNLYGAMKKGWLPDSYGRKPYAAMSKEEKDVIDSFEGEKQYTADLPKLQQFLSAPLKQLPM